MRLEYDANRTCTMLVLKEFDDGIPRTIDWDDVKGRVDSSFEEYLRVTRILVEDFNQNSEAWADDENYSVNELALVMATTSSNQPEAESFLKELGFTPSRPYASEKYEGRSLVTIWHMGAPEFEERVLKYEP